VKRSKLLCAAMAHGHTRLVWLLGALGLLALLPLIAACSASGAKPSDPIRELGKVSTYKAGEPALVFVYTDG